MIVTFISQCEKKALNRTRRVLDAFANRIGDNTWQTVITEKGLLVVKNLLRQTATKNTAVSCHRIRSRYRSQLLWIVGNRSSFNEFGYVAVNRTKKNWQHNEWQNDWYYLPLIKALTAMAALLHDWGKATELFQNKLKSSSKLADPLRHEWISCLLFRALVMSSGDIHTDEGWLDLLSNQSWKEKQLIQAVATWKEEDNLDQLPLMAQWIIWLILTHHRLLVPNSISNLDASTDYFIGNRLNNIGELLSRINANWGYRNCNRTEKDLKACQEFTKGLLKMSNEWTKELRKWATRLKEQIESAKEVDESGCWRVILHHVRLCLMLGDHYYSSLDRDKEWAKTKPPLLFANTYYFNTAETEKTELKQYLDEHLVGVTKQALKTTHKLDILSKGMSRAQDEALRKLKVKSAGDYSWQDKAVQEINRLFDREKDSPLLGGGFIVNMASTGTGKTLANAKVMRALSPDGTSLRYVLTVGLRTLTLQTGDMYRDDIGLSKKDLAVVIGSKAVQELHELNKQTSSGEGNNTQQVEVNKKEKEQNYQEQQGSESLDSLLDNELDYDEPDDESSSFLDNLFPSSQNNREQEKRNQSFLRSPVLVCTIDQMMAATETCGGGKYILPSLRLMSSDLVIDEVDDFEVKDLVAIARLVHLAGMLGRKVMISSATIPPALAEGFFNAYQRGWRLYCAFKKLIPSQSNIATVWIDEFKTQAQWISGTQEVKSSIEKYHEQHEDFVKKRVANLSKEPQRRKAYIVCCDKAKAKSPTEKQEQTYFTLIKQAIINLHEKNHLMDKTSGKRVSFGVVRMAEVDPCIRLAKYLLGTKSKEWPNIAPYVMAYHSQQILALRNEQEKHLDKVLNRKQKRSIPFSISELIKNNEVLKDKVEKAKDKADVIFILVATPVEEVGRDHDFDWAVVEPSSCRSIIQIAGRVLRHRPLLENINRPNIALMDYNLRGLKGEETPFLKPGFKCERFSLANKELSKIIDEKWISKGINAIPRIQPSKTLNKLADLEHIVLKNELLNDQKKGAKSLNGYIEECWFLTALPQYFYPFRKGEPNLQYLQLFVEIDGKAEPKFCERDKKGEYVSQGDCLKMKWNNELEKSQLWLERNYRNILSKIAEERANRLGNKLSNQELKEEIKKLSHRYGELIIALPHRCRESIITPKPGVYYEQLGWTKVEKDKE